MPLIWAATGRAATVEVRPARTRFLASGGLWSDQAVANQGEHRCPPLRDGASLPAPARRRLPPRLRCRPTRRCVSPWATRSKSIRSSCSLPSSLPESAASRPSWTSSRTTTLPSRQSRAAKPISASARPIRCSRPAFRSAIPPDLDAPIFPDRRDRVLPVVEGSRRPGDHRPGQRFGHRSGYAAHGKQARHHVFGHPIYVRLGGAPRRADQRGDQGIDRRHNEPEHPPR